MEISKILKEAKPTLLSFKNGQWVMELECMVPLGWELIRPTTRHLEGREQILYHLEIIDEGRGLVGSTVKLLDSAEGADRVFEVRDGRWVPTIRRIGPLQLSAGGVTPDVDSSRAHREIQQLSFRLAALEQHGASTQMTRMHKLIAALADAQERLNRRLASLEERIARGGIPAAGFEEPSEQPAAAVAKEAAPGLQKQPGPKPAAAPKAQVAPKVSLPPAALPVVKFPPAAELANGTKQLLGQEVTLKESTATGPKFTDTEIKLYMSQIIDDQGNVIGAMLADLRATVYIGGGMILLGSVQLEEMMKAGAPNDDAIDAMGEVFNTLSGLINYIPGNPHVRTTPAEPFDMAAYPWMADCIRVDYTDNLGGRMIFVSTKAEAKVAEVPAEVATPVVEERPARPPALLKFPDGPHVTTVVKQLVAGDLQVKEATTGTVSFTDAKLYASTLVDKDGQVIGAMIADLRATVFVGGGMILLPQDALEEQVAAGEASADALDAMSEVFNTLASSLNSIEGNPHIRTTPAEPLEVEALPWINDPAGRKDYEDSFGGHLVLLSV